MYKGGFSILAWDGWGLGFIRINARLLNDGVDYYNQPVNWFTCTGEEKDELIKRLTEKVTHYYIVNYE